MMLNFLLVSDLYQPMPAGQYLLKLSEHEKTTLPPEFFIPDSTFSYSLKMQIPEQTVFQPSSFD